MKLQILRPSTGVKWVREGLATFRRQPMAFVSLFMLFTVAVLLLSQLPVIGGLLAVMLGPAMTLAVMAATEQAAGAPAGAGREPTAVRPSGTLLVTALRTVRSSARPLAVLGLLYAVVVLALGALAMLITGDPFASAFDAEGKPRTEVIGSAGFQFAVLLRMLFYAPAALAFWHAPALVHWHNVSPVKSLFFSSVTCLRNIGAMTVYGLAWAAVVLLATLVMSIVATLVAALSGAMTIGAALMLGGSLVLSAAFLASTWFTFRDSFKAD